MENKVKLHETQYSNQLKGIWGVIEYFSIMCSVFFGLKALNILPSHTPIANPTTGMIIARWGLTALPVIGIAGFIFTQILRWKIKNNPKLKCKYLKEKD